MHVVLVIDDWMVTKQIPTAPGVWVLSNHMMLPGFDWDRFPFMVLCGVHTYDLLNIKTGVKSQLIKGSSGYTAKMMKWPSAYFVDHGNGRLDFNFAT